jgi:hypothetical protein
MNLRVYFKASISDHIVIEEFTELLVLVFMKILFNKLLLFYKLNQNK